MDSEAIKNAGKMKMIALISSIGCLPFLLIIFITIIVIIIIGGDSEASTGNITYVSGSGDALYDGSYTKSEFITAVKSYKPPDGKKNGHSYSWGYEEFFVANAENFFNITTKYGLDPRFIFCIGIHESEYGTSSIALNKGNFFGWGAYDSSPYDSALEFYDMSAGIETVSNGLSKNYVASNGTYHQEIINKGYDPSTIKGIGSIYASDKGWADKVMKHMENIFSVDFEKINDNKEITNTNLTKLKEYPLEGGSAKVMTKPLTTSQQKSLKNYINSSIETSGFGTGDGVAAAGQSLIYGLYQMGYRLPYKWGGGHNGDLVVGVSNKWGSNGYGYDCSGFVSWTIKNGCNHNFGAKSSSEFYSIDAPSVSIKEAKPGDIMVKNGHVRLVIYNKGNGNIIVAHNSKPSQGLRFSNYDKIDSGYKILDMKKWYSKNCEG